MTLKIYGDRIINTNTYKRIVLQSKDEDLFIRAAGIIDSKKEKNLEYNFCDNIRKDNVNHASLDIVNYFNSSSCLCSMSNEYISRYEEYFIVFSSNDKKICLNYNDYLYEAHKILEEKYYQDRQNFIDNNYFDRVIILPGEYKSSYKMIDVLNSNGCYEKCLLLYLYQRKTLNILPLEERFLNDILDYITMNNYSYDIKKSDISRELLCIVKDDTNTINIGDKYITYHNMYKNYILDYLKDYIKNMNKEKVFKLCI